MEVIKVGGLRTEMILNIWVSSRGVVVGELVDDIDPESEAAELSRLPDLFCWEPVYRDLAARTQISTYLNQKFDISVDDFQYFSASPLRFQMLNGDGGGDHRSSETTRNLVMRDRVTRESMFTQVSGAPPKLNRQRRQVGVITGHSCLMGGHGDDIIDYARQSIAETLAALCIIKEIRSTISSIYAEDLDGSIADSAIELSLVLVETSVRLSSLIESASPEGVFMVDTRPYAFASEVWDRVGISAQLSECESAIQRLRTRLDTYLAHGEARVAQANQRTATVIGLLTVVLLPATLWVGFLGANIREMTVVEGGVDRPASILHLDPVIWISFAVFCVIALALAAFIFRPWQKRAPRHP
ncbi:CorA family divalent cation transporter [Nocardia sp. NPDC004085]